EEGPDGFDDLLLKFSNQDIAASRVIRSIPEPGDVWTLMLTGEFEDGTGFQAFDCVTFVGEPPGLDKPDRPTDLGLRSGIASATPNPFNPTATIAFNLKKSGRVSLQIYDAAGRLIRTLVDDTRPAGSYEVVWNGLDDKGTSVTSGIYFCRFSDGDVLETKKMVLMR
ncbi:MAG TPA: FlgD immunoglobulin-like domain containing protein, partial [Candidatus Krumholzibacterium sp.]|nr:FlgD immunoglobulin-like domain containing protein [Candidatus Krumholzibacterium sp.]